MDKKKPLGLVISIVLLVSACSVPSVPSAPAPSDLGPATPQDKTTAELGDDLLADMPEPGQTALAMRPKPPAPGRSPTPVPPVDDTPQADSPLVALLGDQLPPQPTPDYLGGLARPLPSGVVEGVPPAVPTSSTGTRLLYVNGTLHVWHVDEGRDVDLGWPAVAIECPWLAPDGYTFYFSDEEGAKRVDLANPQDPELLISHFRGDDNPARHRTFCVQGVSEDGQRLLFQARDSRWYQWGILETANGVARVIESPLGPPGEPWHCPGGAVWGQDATLLLSGYSAGTCNQFPGLHKTDWGAPLVPTPVLTATLPHLDQQIPQKAGAWHLTRSPDGQHVAFWFDQDRIAGDASLYKQALYVVDGKAQNPRQLTDGIPGGGGPPAWSNDSSALYYAVGSPFGSLEPRPWQVIRVAMTEEAEQVVAEFPARQVFLVGPVQENRLLLLTLTDDLTYAARVLDLKTGELVNGPAHVAVVGWLP